MEYFTIAFLVGVKMQEKIKFKTMNKKRWGQNQNQVPNQSSQPYNRRWYANGPIKVASLVWSDISGKIRMAKTILIYSMASLSDRIPMKPTLIYDLYYNYNFFSLSSTIIVCVLDTHVVMYVTCYKRIFFSLCHCLLCNNNDDKKSH